MENESERYSKAYYEVFLFAMILMWLPLKVVAYLVPFFCIGWFMIRASSGKILLRSVVYTFLYIIFAFCYYIFYFIVKVDFIIQNAFIVFLTYSTFFFFLVFPPNAQLHKIDLSRYIKTMGVFILLESVIGIMQVVIFVLIYGTNFDTGTGDIVNGTLSVFSFLHPEEANFNNQIYSCNLLLLLLFYAPYAVYHRKGMWICLIGVLAVLLASVWHLFLPFIVIVALVAIWFRSSLSKISTTRILIAAVIVLVGGLSFIIQPKNTQLIAFYFNAAFSKESPKTIVSINSVTKLPEEYPWVYFIGLGPGQYSSRAGLIGTGRYFGRFNAPKKIPFLNPSASEAFNKYVYQKWKYVSTTTAKYGNSTMSRPFYSMLSVLVEFGFIFFAIICFFIFKFIIRMKQVYKRTFLENNSLKLFYSVSCAVLVLFYFSISFFENYMEVTHAIFLGLLLFKYFHSWIHDYHS